MDKRYMTLLIMSALLLSYCASYSLENETIRVEHSISYQKKGSRSEARYGTILINGYSLPNCFDYIHVQGKSYQNHRNTMRFGNHGYFPCDEISISESAQQIASSDLEKGFYLSSLRFRQTPDTWLYLSWKEGAAFVDPLKISRVLSSPPFSELISDDKTAGSFLRKIPAR